MPAGGVAVSIAFDDPTLEPDPTWTDITDNPNFVATISIDRGRQFELDRTDTSTASIAINDRYGLLDPTNTDGAYFEKIFPLLQVKIDLLNPVTAEYTTIWRGYIEEYDYVWDPSQQINRLTLGCVDAFAILNAVEMVPTPVDGGTGFPAFGDDPTGNTDAGIWFSAKNVNDRIIQALGNAGWPTDLQVVFSGNVTVQGTPYDVGDTVMTAIQDAADAEFPGLANVFVDKNGRVVFHGRKAKFDPVGVSSGASPGAWPFQQWKAGDGAAVAASISDTAHIRLLSTNYGLARIINSAYAAPRFILPAELINQVVQDATSIGIYGYRSWSVESLITAGGLDDGLDANDECLLFATYYVANYAAPRNRVSQLSFFSMDPEDPRAAATWPLLVGVDVSDALALTVGSPGGGGFNLEPFYIEGIHYDIKPLNPTMAFVTLSLDLSPQEYFATNPFTGDT